jgi:hypothetical protein
LRAHDPYTSSTLIGWKRQSQSKFALHTTLEGPPEYVGECKMDVKYSYMASYGPCFIVAWTILKNHLLEVGLTQN